MDGLFYFFPDLFPSVCVLPVPNVSSDPLRLHLHDPGHHHREIPGRLQAHHVQVWTVAMGHVKLTTGKQWGM